jgi:hypothetical protein
VSLVPDTPKYVRKKRSFDELGPSQRNKRKRDGREALAEIGVPPNALCDHRPTPAVMLTLTTADRKRIRTINELHIPGEKRMAQCKKELAHTHGTETASFMLVHRGEEENESAGAYVTDPLCLVRSVTAGSPFVAVGGDKGGGHTKLGITYINNITQGTQAFLPLLVYEGDDNYEDMNALRTANLTKFVGESTTHTHIFSVLQHILDTYPLSFLNGDWPFISAIIGHRGASSFYPCPICIVERSFLLSEESYRRPTDGNSLHHNRIPLLNIPSDRIVPTPLHLYLGINNRIIFDAFKEIVGESHLLTIIKTVKSIHSAGCGGLSDLYSLNGPEITRWIKQERCSQLISESAERSALSRYMKARITVMAGWMKQLHQFLLHSNQWTLSELLRFRSFLTTIYAHWDRTTGDHPFPKLHMLRHAVEFAERYRILGAASESQIESFHYRFNTLYHQTHRNMSQQPLERMRRCLADVVASAAAPLLGTAIPPATESISTRARASNRIEAAQAT